MADPLTIITGAGGFISLTLQITQILTNYTSSIVDAPLLAKEVARETCALSCIFQELHELLEGTNEASETAFDLGGLQQVLEGCVETVLQLDEPVTGLKQFEDGTQIRQRVKWACEEPAITRILRNLQDQKLSLSVLLNLYVAKSTRELCRRTSPPATSTPRALDWQNDRAISEPMSRLRWAIQRKYIDDLMESRVYRQVKRKISIDSRMTQSTRQTTWSRFQESISSAEFSTFAFRSMPWLYHNNELPTESATEPEANGQLDPDCASGLCSDSDREPDPGLESDSDWESDPNPESGLDPESDSSSA